MNYIDHPRIVPDTVEARSYQVSMAKGCIGSNSLVILPTGLGKTIVALQVAAEYLPKGKILIMAPTKPLLEQHIETFTNLLAEPKVCVLNGNITPEKRTKQVAESEVVIATPQTIANDLDEGRYDLDDFSLVIYDEAHRAVGDYAYVRVAQHCHREMRSIGMTASPGANMNRIKEVCMNLDLRRVDARTETDPDVSPYMHETQVNRIDVNLPQDLADITALLSKQMDHYVGEMISLGVMNPSWPASKTHLITIQNTLQMRLASGEKTAIVYKGLALEAMCMKVYHAKELAETQGMTSLRACIERLEAEAKQEKGGRSARDVVNREEFLEVKKIAERSNVEHPKVSRVMSLVSQILQGRPESKIMVFAHYRETCDLLVSKLSTIPFAKVGKLVGQAGNGLSQKEQVEILGRLRSGEVNVIVSTSVGEEGLDISSTDAVIFYEPIASEIRTIQRRGRTGRKNDGDVYLLVTKNTMDEIAEKTSERKEEAMKANIEKLNYELSMGRGTFSAGTQRRLEGF